MRTRLAVRALMQSLHGRGIDFSQMTDEEVEQLWIAAGNLTRVARQERQARLHAKVKALVADHLRKTSPS